MVQVRKSTRLVLMPGLLNRRNSSRYSEVAFDPTTNRLRRVNEDPPAVMSSISPDSGQNRPWRPGPGPSAWTSSADAVDTTFVGPGSDGPARTASESVPPASAPPPRIIRVQPAPPPLTTPMPLSPLVLISPIEYEAPATPEPGSRFPISNVRGQKTRDFRGLRLRRHDDRVDK
jgi:hypothetical protein